MLRGRALAGFFRDARHGQILVLAVLLFFGVAWFDFDIRPWNVVAALMAALITQYGGQKLFTPDRSLDFRSPLITSLSLSLLLRADGHTLLAAWPMAAAGFIAIASKFVLRFKNKHIFNPANLAIVVMIFTPFAWTTPGQWGPMMVGAALMAGAGFFVTYKAARFDVPLVFLASYGALLFARALWLGDPFTIPWLNLQNGALILFAFFMISDPMTTPDRPLPRAIFAFTTALLAYLLQYHFYTSEGLFIALTLTCLVRPLLDLAFPATPYQWPRGPFVIIPRRTPHEKTTFL